MYVCVCVCSHLSNISVGLTLFVLHCAAPSSVMSLRGSGFATSVQIAWTPPTEPDGIITGYFLTYSTGSGATSSENVPASVTCYTVTGLEENTLYHFTVSAETTVGRGEGSSISVKTVPNGKYV